MLKRANDATDGVESLHGGAVDLDDAIEGLEASTSSGRFGAGDGDGRAVRVEQDTDLTARGLEDADGVLGFGARLRCDGGREGLAIALPGHLQWTIG